MNLMLVWFFGAATTESSYFSVATALNSQEELETRELLDTEESERNEHNRKPGTEGQRNKNLSQSPRDSRPVSEEKINEIFDKKTGVIEVQGLKRIEKEAVQSKLTSKVNEFITREGVRQDIGAIFKMGYFDDVSVFGEPSNDGKVKIFYKVKERPAISKVEFEGNERISTSDLKEVVKIKEWSILDINKVKDDVNLIQKHYEDKGFYLAKVNFTVKTLKEDEVELTFRISDYEKIQIKKITFLNNKKFSDEQLKGILQDTREGGMWSFLSGSGNFKESAFKQDMQKLTYWYLDHGYVKFRPENPVITVSDDKKWLFISIYVDEGEQYKMGDLDFGGDLLFSKEELFKEITLGKSEIFSISKRNVDIQKLTEKYQDLGYAFVNVIPKMNMHDEARTVDIEYDFEKGNLVHFGEINILGNTKTHDKVIRRELKIHEGELYSGSKLRQSRENVERLGYFVPGEVIFNTVTPKGEPDILNLDITIKERSTGTITLGAGYGSVNGFFFTSSISEMNLLGRGQTVSFSAQMSADKDSRRFSLGFTDPYAFDSMWSLGFNIYRDVSFFPSRYGFRKLGFDMRAGYPVAEFIYAYITYKNEGFVVPYAFPLPDYLAEPDRGVLSSVTWSLVRDKRNNRFETTSGNYQSVALETAILGGKKKFLKLILNNRYYTRIIGDLVLRNNTELGHIAGWDHQPPPPTEKFYLGGPNNMKGFDQFRLGPLATVIGDNQGALETYPTGGSYEAFSLFEMEYPLIRDAGLKWVFFFDIGNTWEKFPSKGEPFVLRADAGLGLRWFSPIGPLRFEWGFPFVQKDRESSPVFAFFIGPPF